MTVAAGETILAADVVNASAGAADAGKIPKLNSSGLLDRSILNTVKYGGTGADGALSISSGTTNIDLAGASVVVKNYTSISITGTAAVTFTNPHANGTIIIFKSQGNVTITSSANPTIDLRSLGATGGSGGANEANGSVGNLGMTSFGVGTDPGDPGVKNSSAGAAGTKLGPAITIHGKLVPLGCGSGGGGGAGGGEVSLSAATAPGGGGGGSVINTGTAGGAGSTSSTAGSGGAGGRGGGALYIECDGALNITSVINAAGSVGVAATTQGGGGGGGAGGTIVILYRTLTANTGTYTVTAGSGGAGAGTGGNGGDGGAGTSLVAANVEFV